MTPAAGEASLVEVLDHIRSCRIVDLSSDVGNHARGPFGTTVEVLEPHPGAEFFCRTVLPLVAPHAVGRFGPDDFPDRAFLRHEMVRASTHAGSHIDAPGHYGPSRDGGGGAINDAPLSSFIGTGVAFDARHVAGRRITAGDLPIAERIERAGIRPDTGGLAFVCTGGGTAIGADVVTEFLDHGVHVIGTDGESFDGPFGPMLDDYLATGDRDVLWPAHMLGRRRPYYQLERLTNLELLPEHAFLVAAFPILIGGATAAWTRAVAFVPPTVPEE